MIELLPLNDEEYIDSYLRRIEGDLLFNQENTAEFHEMYFPYKGDFVWEHKQSGKIQYLAGGSYYLSAAIYFLNSLKQFFFNFDENNFDDYIFYCDLDSAYGLQLLIVKLLDKSDFYVSFGFFGDFDFRIMWDKDGNSTIKSIEDVQRVIKAVEEKKEKVFIQNGKTYESYLCVSEKELFINFLNFFDLAIEDIPKKSRIWQLTILKKAIQDYKTLKTYAQDQGWI